MSRGGRRRELSHARRQLKRAAWRRVKMVLYFQTIDPQRPGCTWPVDSSSTALTAFASMAADPHFVRRA